MCAASAEPESPLGQEVPKPLMVPSLLEDPNLRRTQELDAPLTLSRSESLRHRHRSVTGQNLRFFNQASCAGTVVSNPVFEYMTLFVIFLNAIWLGIDTDLNHATSIHDIGVGVIIAENLFCFYFTGEILLRFAAFRKKLDCLRDGWFLFDSLLVVLMVCETWILPWALPQGKGNPLEDFGALRLLRLLRLSRLIRLMRSVPELLTIVKGIARATRSVASVLLFLTCVDYVFAIVFTGAFQKKPGDEDRPDACDNWEEEGAEFTANDCLKESYFGNIGYSMFTLLCNGTLLDDVAPLVKALREAGPIWLMLFFLFIVLSSFTVLNMLIGILVEVVEKTSAEEKDKMKQENVKEVVTQAFQLIDTDGSNMISRAEFDVMCEERRVLVALEKAIGIDSSRFTEMRDLLFSNSAGERELNFEAFLKLLIRLRPEEQASTMDVQQFRKLIGQQEHILHRHINKLDNVVQSCKQIAKGSRGRFGDTSSSWGAVGDDATLDRPLKTPEKEVKKLSTGSNELARLVTEASDAELVQELRRRLQQGSPIGTPCC